MCAFAESDTKDALVCMGIFSVILTRVSPILTQSNPSLHSHCKRKGEELYLSHKCLSKISFSFKFILWLNNGTPGTTI